jgi:5'-3' exonuclease
MLPTALSTSCCVRCAGHQIIPSAPLQRHARRRARARAPLPAPTGAVASGGCVARICARSVAGTYTDLLPTNGYLTSKRELHLDAFEKYVRVLASHEPVVFERKRQRAAGGGGGGRNSRRDMRSRPSAASNVVASDPLDYKREYYLQKLGLHPKDLEARKALVHSYLEGLSWCLAYYHDGCASWYWCDAAMPRHERRAAALWPLMPPLSDPEQW